MMNLLSKHLFFPLWELKDGAHRRRYLKELNWSQWQPPESIRERQWDQTLKIVNYAFKHCPYYRDRLGNEGFNGHLRDWVDFRRLPVLTKDDIRENGDGLLSTEFSRSDLVEARTGGSTGTSLTVYFDEQCQEMRNAAAMRSDRWAGWDLGEKVAALWGNPPVADTLKKKLRSLLLDRMIFLDTMDISEITVQQFADYWKRTQPKFLYGHSHSVYILATFLRRLKIATIKPSGIISTSMMLLNSERKVIEEVFGCRVTNRYGCEEVGLISCECEQHNGLHLNTDHLVIEFLLEDGTEATPGEEADIVITDLINHGMPLIRYKVGDMGVPCERICPCGRGLPLMEKVVGRRADFLKRPDGSLVAGVSLVERTLTAIPGIEQMQLIQNELTRVRINLVKDGNFTQNCEIRLVRELSGVFGPDMKINIVHVPALDKTRAGKYRLAICNV